nr:hypothetical protein [Tanacetum cinerariifolium]
FEKIDSSFQQTSSLKPYVSNVILEKIILDLEDEVVSLLEKEKANLETIESLKSKGFESGENVSSESENQIENDCLVVEKEYDKEENPKKKGSSNTSNVDLSAVSHSNLNANVKRYSHKDLLACNNSHLGETSSAYVCNDAMNVSCNSRMCDLLDDNNFFIFDDESIVKICLWIINSGCSKHMTGPSPTRFVKREAKLSKIDEMNGDAKRGDNNVNSAECISVLRRKGRHLLSNNERRRFLLKIEIHFSLSSWSVTVVM